MTTFDLQMLDEAPSGVLIENVQPLVDCGRYPLKREVGDRIDVTADIFREGHDLIAAIIQYRQRGEDDWTEAPMTKGDNDAWSGGFHVDTIGAAQFRVLAWPDHFESWRSELRKKVDAGLEVSSELLEGRNIVEETFVRASEDDQQWMEGILDSAQIAGDQPAAAEIMLGEDLAELVHRNANREHSAVAGPYPIYVDRIRARFAAWYSMFPRSAGTVEGESATFKDVEAQLPRIQKMGFNVLYFTPIHPIGEQNRKGKNNSVVSVPGDPGVPYAIGSKDGGHDAVEPGLGTWDDFDELAGADAPVILRDPSGVRMAVSVGDPSEAGHLTHLPTVSVNLTKVRWSEVGQ